MANKSKKMNKKNGRKGRGRSVGTFRVEGAFPPTCFKLLNYSDVITLTEAAAGAGQYQVFRTGDVYDPDYTGVGHQPMYFDQLCSSIGPYLTFCVPKSRFQLRFSNVSAYPVLVSVLPANYGASPSTRITASERTLAWKHLLAPNGTGGATIQKDITCDNPKLIGQPMATYLATNTGNFGGSAGGAYLHITIWGIGGIGSVVLHVNAVYTTKFLQLGPEATS